MSIVMRAPVHFGAGIVCVQVRTAVIHTQECEQVRTAVIHSQECKQVGVYCTGMRTGAHSGDSYSGMQAGGRLLYMNAHRRAQR